MFAACSMLLFSSCTRETTEEQTTEEHIKGTWVVDDIDYSGFHDNLGEELLFEDEYDLDIYVSATFDGYSCSISYRNGFSHFFGYRISGNTLQLVDVRGKIFHFNIDLLSDAEMFLTQTAYGVKYHFKRL